MTMDVLAVCPRGHVYAAGMPSEFYDEKSDWGQPVEKPCPKCKRRGSVPVPSGKVLLIAGLSEEDRSRVMAIVADSPDDETFARNLREALPAVAADIDWFLRHPMTRTVVSALIRRDSVPDVL